MPISRSDSDNDAIHAIRLYRSPRIGPVAFHKIMESCNSHEEAYDLVHQKAREAGISDYVMCSQSDAEREYAQGMEMGAHFILSGAPDYPANLAEAPDCPPFLWALGRKELLDAPRLAIIGSRNPTHRGVRITLQLAKLLSYESVVIVSGLARGIDAAAHEASVTGGTIGVVAGGVDVLYPKQNAQLQQIMSEDGLVVSEMPFGHPPTARDFPKRNRIIAGLSQAVLVVEGTQRSGTRLTVNDAECLGRPIMAVPGCPLSGLSDLPNELIVGGACLVRDIDDIFAAVPALGFKTDIETPQTPTPRACTPVDHSDDAALGRALIEGRALDQLDGQIKDV